MNYLQIKSMCINLEKDFHGMGRETKLEDGVVLDTILGLYNTTEIDWEEVKWLWMQYLETGNLYFSDAVEMAKSRKTKEELKALLEIKAMFI